MSGINDTVEAYSPVSSFQSRSPSLRYDDVVKRYEKLMWRILGGRSDANIRFVELCSLLQSLGFEVRVRGSHHVFRKEGVEEHLNIQEDGRMAKVYQVRQVRNVILKYGLAEKNDA